MHGGKTPVSIAAAERRRQEAVVEAAVVTFGLPRRVDPAAALLEEVHRTAGHVAWLAQVVAELGPEALVWGVSSREEKSATEFPGVDVTEAARPNVWLDLYQRERAHLVAVCKAALAAGVEERRVRLAEQQGALLVEVIRGVLDDLDLSGEQRARVAEVVPRRLRLAAAETGAGVA